MRIEGKKPHEISLPFHWEFDTIWAFTQYQDYPSVLWPTCNALHSPPITSYEKVLSYISSQRGLLERLGFFFLMGGLLCARLYPSMVFSQSLMSANYDLLHMENDNHPSLFNLYSWLCFDLSIATRLVWLPATWRNNRS